MIDFKRRRVVVNHAWDLPPNEIGFSAYHGNPSNAKESRWPLVPTRDGNQQHDTDKEVVHISRSLASPHESMARSGDAPQFLSSPKTIPNNRITQPRSAKRVIAHVGTHRGRLVILLQSMYAHWRNRTRTTTKGLSTTHNKRGTFLLQVEYSVIGALLDIASRDSTTIPLRTYLSK